ncbi:hypothetical protein [Sanguibacteroides justesenii]|nr:hypothetical protein [Sanguibacteroides justesenii]
MNRRVVLFCMTVGLLSLSEVVTAENLDSLSKEKRDKKLIKMAKEVVLRHGPGFYREYKPPVIKSQRVSDKTVDMTVEMIKKYKGRFYYTVEYPYNKKEEIFWGVYSAKVFIWKDTGKVFYIEFGGTIGIENYDMLTEKEKRQIKTVQYHKTRPLKHVRDTFRDPNGEIIRIENRYE